MCPDTTGGSLDDHNVRRRIWAPLLTAAELSHHRLHDLRHSFATLHLEAGTNPVWVSEQLGHHDVGFTLRTYVSRTAAATPTCWLREGPEMIPPPLRIPLRTPRWVDFRNRIRYLRTHGPLAQLARAADS